MQLVKRKHTNGREQIIHNDRRFYIIDYTSIYVLKRLEDIWNLYSFLSDVSDLSNEFEKIINCFLILTQEHELEQIIRGKLFCIWIAFKNIIQECISDVRSFHI